MRIGVVCEGPTDAHAIVCFLQASLTHRGITPDFIPIQPDTDNTRPLDGGWGAVFLWLKKNGASQRSDSSLSIQKLFAELRFVGNS